MFVYVRLTILQSLAYDNSSSFELDKYLDDAYLAHLPTARIIHGRGTGALKAAVHQLLRRSSVVASYRLGAYGEGSGGVTIVEFKTGKE